MDSPKLNKVKPIIKISTVSTAWLFGILSAVFFVIIYNIISKYVPNTGYDKIFCPP